MLLHLKVFSNLHLGHLMALKIKNKIKTRGKIYTPKDIVKKILDLIDYSGTKIVGKKIIDNSCGDGRFLQEITRRYCIECKKLNLSNSQIKHLLETNIYGIEVEKEEIIKCKNNLNCILKDFNLTIHSPNKTLVCIIHIDDVDNVCTKEEYTNYYLNNYFNITYSDTAVRFGSSIIYNNYELFADKVANGVRSL